MSDIEAVIFDSDGTLIDTTQLILEGFKKVLADFAFTDQANDDVIKGAIGGHIPEIFSKITGHDPDSDVIQRMTSHLDQVQDMLAPTMIRAYAGEREMLETLKSKGIRLGLFTSGTLHQVERNFRAINIEYSTLFDSVVTYDDGLESKPSPAGLLKCIEKMQVNPDKTIYIGDHDVDIISGKRANVAMTVGINHGFHGASELTAAGADRVIHSLEEVLSLI